MPELPEVETTLRGIRPHLEGRILSAVTVRESRLRWPVSEALYGLKDCPVIALRRRAKYLLIELEAGQLMIHLGMSGTLRVVDAALPLRKHDHVDLLLDSGKVLRFNDPRRFGSVLYQPGAEPHEKLHYGQRHGGRGGQYLRAGKPVSRWHSSVPASRAYFT